MEKFVFLPVEQGDLDSMARTAKIFNLSRDTIMTEKVTLASVDDETWGSAVERLDLALWDAKSSQWVLLDIENKIDGYNEIPLGYVLEGQDFTRVMVIIRRMSSFIMDKVSSGQTVYIYSVVSKSFEKAVKDPVFLGRLAQNRIYLDREPRQVYRQIRDTIEDKEKQTGLISYVKDFLKRIEGDSSG